MTTVIYSPVSCPSCDQQTLEIQITRMNNVDAIAIDCSNCNLQASTTYSDNIHRSDLELITLHGITSELPEGKIQE